MLAFHNRGLAYHHQGDLARAISDYDEVVRLNSQNSMAFNNRCWARVLSELDLTTVRADCDRAIALFGNEPMYWGNRALVGVKQELFKEAWSDFNVALEKKPEFAGYLYGRGIAALRLGRTEEGNADVAEATKLEPNIADTFAGYGVTP